MHWLYPVINHPKQRKKNNKLEMWVKEAMERHSFSTFCSIFYVQLGGHPKPQEEQPRAGSWKWVHKCAATKVHLHPMVLIGAARSTTPPAQSSPISHHSTTRLHRWEVAVHRPSIFLPASSPLPSPVARRWSSSADSWQAHPRRVPPLTSGP